jgi:hypothetical protein
MPEIKEKTTFTACDGREFKTREEAEQYEIMKHATEQFQEAVRDYNRTLAKTLKTADGYPFELGGAFYIVWEHAYTEGIRHEYLYARDARVSYDGRREPTILFIGRSGGDDKVTEFELANIYAQERNAMLRLLEIRKKRLGWLMDDIAAMERQLGIKQENRC